MSVAVDLFSKLTRHWINCPKTWLSCHLCLANHKIREIMHPLYNDLKDLKLL